MIYADTRRALVALRAHRRRSSSRTARLLGLGDAAGRRRRSRGGRTAPRSRVGARARALLVVARRQAALRVAGCSRTSRDRQLDAAAAHGAAARRGDRCAQLARARCALGSSAAWSLPLVVLAGRAIAGAAAVAASSPRWRSSALRRSASCSSAACSSARRPRPRMPGACDDADDRAARIGRCARLLRARTAAHPRARARARRLRPRPGARAARARRHDHRGLRLLLDRLRARRPSARRRGGRTSRPTPTTR